jgi:hypothetical protein
VKIYRFYGIATVSVTTEVEADSEETAKAMVDEGDCLWICDDVDGDVDDVQLTGVEG